MENIYYSFLVAVTILNKTHCHTTKRSKLTTNNGFIHNNEREREKLTITFSCDEQTDKLSECEITENTKINTAENHRNMRNYYRK